MTTTDHTITDRRTCADLGVCQHRAVCPSCPDAQVTLTERAGLGATWQHVAQDALAQRDAAIEWADRLAAGIEGYFGITLDEATRWPDALAAIETAS